MSVMSRKPTEQKELRGGYFRYCQWCEHDGNCTLRHHEFMGAPDGGQVDKTPYSGHEDLRWAFSIFQDNTSRATCNGVIRATGSIFLPLGCQCGTVISGVCRKMKPNEKHVRALAIAEKIAKERGIQLSEVDPAEFPLSEFDPNYEHIAVYD